MFEKWLIGMVISFVLRQVAKFKSQIEWAKVKADLELRVRALVPGEFFDSEAVALCNVVVDGVVAVLSAQADLESILTKLAASDWDGALAAVVALLKKLWATPTVHQKKVLAALGEDLSAAA